MAIDRNVFLWFKRLASIAAALLLLLVPVSPRLFAQVDEGAINGTVTDTSGAAVPNAHVTLLNTEQGITLETTTSNSGEYVFSPVRIGHYTITVTAPGFSTTTQQNVTVAVGARVQANVQLKLGASSQTIQVTAAPPELQTSDAAVGQVVNQQSVNNLPLNGRNFTFLAQITAGVNTPQADTRGNAASGAFSANGLRPAQNNYLLDGIDNNSNAVDFLNGTNFVILPPVDAIQEFKVQTGAFSALAGTPRQLDVLAARGVVDAGGAGLCVVLDALSAAISGTRPESYDVPAPVQTSAHAPAHVPATPGHVPAPSGDATPEYEVTYLIEADEPAIAELRAQLARLGNSLVVSGSDRQWHVHVHVADAGAVIEAGLAKGRLAKITITYLNEVPPGTAAPSPAPPDEVAGTQHGVAVIAEGAGLREILARAGAAVIAAGAEDCQAGLDELAAAGTPMTLITEFGPRARRWPPGWPVIEVESPVQSLAAIAVHDERNDRADDLATMRRAAAGVRWASLATAEPGAAGSLFAGWVAGRLAAAGPDQAPVATALADALLAGAPEMITMVTGRDADPGLGAAVAAHIAAAAPGVEVVCYDGEMTSSVLLIGAE